VTLPEELGEREVVRVGPPPHRTGAAQAHTVRGGAARMEERGRATVRSSTAAAYGRKPVSN